MLDFNACLHGGIFPIQFLNIAGLGPIFGAIAGAMSEPAAFLMDRNGKHILQEAVHGLLSGMNVRSVHDGLSISEVGRAFTLVQR